MKFFENKIKIILLIGVVCEGRISKMGGVGGFINRG
jgi:hypothetical protein